MEQNNDTKPAYSLQVALALFILAAPLVNLVALFPIHQAFLEHIAQVFTFFYMILTPGLFLMPFLTKKKLPFALGIAFSVALSVFTLMFVGLGSNTFLPMLGITQPLSTIPLLLTFDVVILVLFLLSNIYETDFILVMPTLNLKSWLIVMGSFLFPLLAIVGALRLNNNGSIVFTMMALVLVVVFIPIIIADKDTIAESVTPIVLYMMALSLLLMNSMRGSFITGHDILLEYHVFTLTNNAHLWNMAFYQDPYNACLSLTILPTYLQSFLHVNPAYIYKFFTQFLGAIPVVVVYYLTRQYVSNKISLLASFLYITFPTFMVDMAFLNRQGIAFIFFGLIIFILMTDDYFSERIKLLILFLLGTGMVFSHYSTSYIAVPLLIATYLVNRLMRLIVKAKRPQWLFRLINKLGNLDMYQKPIRLKFVFILGLAIIMVVWSTAITKTSTSLISTIQQIGTSLEKPFSLDEQTGPAKYSILSSQIPTPETLLNQFVQDGIKQENVSAKPSEFYPLSITESYPATPVSEYIAPLTNIGSKVQSMVHISLTTVFDTIKQLYAKILQVLLIIGLIGLLFGYSFKKQLLKKVPIEFIALSISGIIILIGQTVLPASAIDYGLLRLFQQNLLFLVLPIFLGLLTLASLLTRNHKKQLWICVVVLLFFFSVLSGLVTQITGAARPLLALNNNGLYYDSYYTHAEEVASAEWLAQENKVSALPIQAAHFSDIKMLAYGHIGSYIELLPETTKRESYVYLNYDNVKTSNILEIIDGYVVYYHFPMDFLKNNKNLIYNNGGSEIYR